MKLDAAMRDFLLSHSGVTDAVETRVFPYGRLPQKKGQITIGMPAITTQSGEEVAHETMDGASAYRRVRVSLAFWAESGKSVIALDETVRCLLHGYKGSLGELDTGAVFARSVTPVLYQDDVNLYQRVRDYMVHVMNG